ncbi:MAG: hypothetical protein AAGK04_05820 [Planctomycetota bacterium]
MAWLRSVIGSFGHRGVESARDERRARRERRNAARLAEMAGGCSVEALEDRRYLFSLTIDAVPVGAEVATARTVFGYTIPVLVTSEDAGTRDFDVTVEEFDDDALGPINRPEIFEGSMLRLSLVDFPLGGAPASVIDLTPGDPDDEPQALSLGFQPGSAALFEAVTDEPEDGQLASSVPTKPMSGFAFTSLGALDTANTTINFYRVFAGLDLDLDGMDDRVLLASFTDGALAAEGVGGTFTFDIGDADDFGLGPGSILGFDQVEIVSSISQTLVLDDVTYQEVTDTIFADVVETRVFGAEVWFTGPEGASVSFTDLYGRDMIQTLGLGRPEGAELTLVDSDDNGIPNFNDGIGRIEISGANELSSLRIFGGQIDTFTAGDEVDFFQFVQGGFVFTRAGFTGLHDQFEDAGFGFFANFADTDVSVHGLSPAGSSVIIGSPFDRPLTNYNPLGLPPGVTNPVVQDAAFNDTGADASNNFTEGIFFTGGSPFGVVNAHAMVFGSSLFEGAVEGVGLGALYGSFAIEGDVGEFLVSSDAGFFRLEGDSGFGGTDEDRSFRTASQITLGRTVREVAIGGESRADVTVLSRVNEQELAPPRDILTYTERETIEPFDQTLENPEQIVIDRLLAQGIFVFSFSSPFDTNPMQFPFDFGNVPAIYSFGQDTYRNNTILSSEFVGSIGTGVLLSGEVGFFNGFEAEDTSDVFAFSASENRSVVIQSTAGVYTRVVDDDGRTLAALQGGQRNRPAPSRFTFEPPTDGTFYLVVTSTLDPVADGDEFDGVSYSITLTGMAPVTLGSYRTGGGSGSNIVTALGGNIGTIRVGTAFFGSAAGAELSPSAVINTTLDDDLLMTFRTGSYSAPAGSIFNITTGSDIQNGTGAIQVGPLNISTGLDLGQVNTGVSGLANDGGALDGDIFGTVNFDIGRHIGYFDILGGIGVDGDQGIGDTGTVFGGSYTIVTGTQAGVGDIGVIRTGAAFFAGGTSIELPRDSTLGAFLVQQDLGDDQGGADGNFGFIGAPTIVTGLGSDVRFIDTPVIDSEASADTTQTIFAEQPLTFIDDGGAVVTVQVLGTMRPGAALGFVRLVPITGSLGVAIATIEVDLSGGERLDVITSGVQADVVSIGRITVTDSANGAAIRLDGQTEIDVWQIDQRDGDGLTQVENLTVGGDIVSLDLQELERLIIAGGNLGRTQVPDYGLDTIGPRLGVASGLQGEVGSPLGFTPGAAFNEFNGGIFQPVTAGYNGLSLFLDNSGGFFDPYLNGLVLRNSFIQEVRVSGAVGDVILQGAGTAIITLTANSDSVTPAGEFHGIVGSIYAPLINTINVGDGLLGTSDAPLPEVGIFAEDEIGFVLGGAPGREVNLSGVIGASNLVVSGPVTFTTQAGLTSVVGGTGGIGTIQLVGGGDFRDLSIQGGTLSRWWEPFTGGTSVDRAVIGQVLGTDANFFRSEISAARLDTLQLVGGAYDGSLININDDIGAISADEFRNSTLGGALTEASASIIVGGEDLQSISTNGNAGNIEDLIVNIEGSLLGGVTAATIARLDFNVDNVTSSIAATQDILASVVRTGRLDAFSAGESIRSSQLRVAGAIQNVTSGGDMLNVSISSEGPDGRIDLISSGTGFVGDIVSVGPIGTVQTLAGDLIATIETTSERGTIQRLDASNDLVLNVNAAAAINELIAGRHVGEAGAPNVILSRGGINLVDASEGQLYADVRAGGVIDRIEVGGAINRPGASTLGDGSIESFDRINTVVIDGDFGADITSFSGGIGTITLNNGSLLPTGSISAFDGNIGGVAINAGHLLGDIHADYILFDVSVNPSADGVFGDIGINPTLSAGVFADANRNQLPPGVGRTAAIDGPSITAGQNIGNIAVNGGSVFETFIFAGRAIGNLSVSGSIQNDGLTNQRGSVLAAGDSIFNVDVKGSVVNTYLLAGATDFGEDLRPGGIGVNADTVKPGRIEQVSIAGLAANVMVTAGIEPGDDGVFGTGDDESALGVSTVQTLSVGENGRSHV